MKLYVWELGPIQKVLPRFRVCRVSPNQPDEPWVYISVGSGKTNDVEFFILSAEENPRHIESLAIVAHFFATIGDLFIGQIVNIGRPWLDGSKCDHFLVSLPYPYGETLEWCTSGDDSTQVLWLLPITKEEADFAASHGLEPLEQIFDDTAIDAIDPYRPSAISKI